MKLSKSHNLLFKIFNCFIGLTLFTNLNGYAQILDDSTKQVYSAKTSKYVLVCDYLNGKYYKPLQDTNKSRMSGIHSPDTTINGIHEYNNTFRNNELFQDLGTYLSPTQKVFYESPSELGKQLGFTTLDPYTINSKEMKYYDTKSPFSKLNYLQGRRGQQALSVELSRNIVKNWNVSMELRRQTSRRIVASSTGLGGGVKPIESSNYIFSFNTRYFSPNKKYQILAHINHAHQVYFNHGGIKPTKLDSIVSNNFKYELAQSYFTSARTIDRRIGYQIFQEYAINPAQNIQLYSLHEYTKRTNRFTHNLVASKDNRTFKPDTLFYSQSPLFLPQYGDLAQRPQYQFSTLYTDDRTDYHNLENETGIKAQKDLFNIRTYLRRRDFNYSQLNYKRDTLAYSADTIILQTPDSVHTDRKFTENFIGANAKLEISKLASILLDAEYMLGRDYRYKIEIDNKFIQLHYSKVFHSPTLVQLQNSSNLKTLSWNNISQNGDLKFSNVMADKIKATLSYENKYLVIKPSLCYEQINNLIYFDTEARPKQTSKKLTFTSAELVIGIKLWKISFESYLRYTQQNLDSFLIAPKIYNHSRLFFQNSIFKKAAYIQFGADSYWRDAYYGAAYMPINQQFYNNYTFLLNHFWQIDLFLNIQIKNAAVYFRFTHLNQAGKGYFTTPSYTAMPSSFDFGIRWLFFD